jgi:hypothetical protein
LKVRLSLPSPRLPTIDADSPSLEALDCPAATERSGRAGEGDKGVAMPLGPGVVAFAGRPVLLAARHVGAGGR